MVPTTNRTSGEMSRRLRLRPAIRSRIESSWSETPGSRCRAIPRWQQSGAGQFHRSGPRSCYWGTTSTRTGLQLMTALGVKPFCASNSQQPRRCGFSCRATTIGDLHRKTGRERTSSPSRNSCSRGRRATWTSYPAMDAPAQPCASCSSLGTGWSRGSRSSPLTGCLGSHRSPTLASARTGISERGLTRPSRP